MAAKALRLVKTNGVFRGSLVLLLGLAVILVLGSLASSPIYAAQASGGTTLRVEVELITVEVIVLDKKGSLVRSLKKENFRLYEDGKQQTISTFDEVVDNPAQLTPTSLADIDDSGPNHGKVVLILFDDSTITAGQLKMTRDSAEKYVKEHMRPWDLFAVASYGMSLKVLQNYTHDAGKVIEAIHQPATSFASNAAQMQSDTRQVRPGAGIPDATASQGSMDSSVGAPRSQNRSPMGNQEAKYRAATLLRTLSYVSSSVARVKGRKSVLLYSEDISITPDIQNEFNNTVSSAQKANVSFYTIDARGLNLGGSQTSQILGSPSGKTLMQQARGGFEPVKSLIQSLVPLTGMLDGTPQVLLLSPLFQQGQGGGGGQPGGGSGGGTGGGAGSGTGGAGGGAGAGGAGGTGTTGTTGTTGSAGNTTTGNTSSGRTSSTDMNPRYPQSQGEQEFPQFQDARMENILRSLATETGGSPIFNTNNFNERLDKVDQELSNYYVLGFQSGNPKRDGKFRKLEVKTDMKGVNLKYRKGYVDPRPLDVLAGTKGERSLMAAVSSPTPATQLPLTFRAVYFYESPGLARIPVVAKIRTASIDLKKKGGQLGSELNVMGVAYAEDGSVAARFSEVIHILFDKEKEQTFRSQDIPYKNYFKLRPGKYQLKLAVSDEKGKVGSVEEALVVPVMPESGLAVSSLVVADQLTRLPDLIQNLQAKLLDDADPMVFNGVQITPSAGNQLPSNSPLRVFYKVYNLPGAAGQRKFVAKIQLVNDKGEAQNLPPIPLDQNVFATGKSEIVVGLILPLEKTIPGKYKLVIETAETTSNQAVTVQTDVQFL